MEEEEEEEEEEVEEETCNREVDRRALGGRWRPRRGWLALGGRWRPPRAGPGDYGRWRRHSGRLGADERVE